MGTSLYESIICIASSSRDAHPIYACQDVAASGRHPDVCGRTTLHRDGSLDSARGKPLFRIRQVSGCDEEGFGGTSHQAAWSRYSRHEEPPSNYHPDDRKQDSRETRAGNTKAAHVRSPNYCRLQSAHRAGHSTETAFVKLVDDVLESVDNGSAVALVSLDISAAFHTVNHNDLLDKLKAEFGIVVTSLRRVESYLHGRTSFGKVGSSSSSTVQATSGVPQGSVFGPIQFTAYVSPIGRLIDIYSIGYHKYSDDRQLYTALTIDGAALDRLADRSNGLQLWFWISHLLNPDTSEIMPLGAAQRRRRQKAAVIDHRSWKAHQRCRIVENTRRHAGQCTGV